MWRRSVRVAALAAAVAMAAPPPIQEWPVYGGDQGGSKYSTLDQINRSNVSKLQLAWEWKTGEKPDPTTKVTPGMFEVTPLMIGGTLYLSTSYNRVVALDAQTGTQLWAYDPQAYAAGQVPNGTGFVHRGVAAWKDPQTGKYRILMNSRAKLIALDAETGKLISEFGDNGVTNLVAGLIWETNPQHYTNTSPPVVYKDLVIVGNGVADRLVYKKDPPGDVRGFSAKTGKQVWSFHTIPQKGEFGNETWGNDAASFTGHTNVWAPMTLDEARGLLYMPVSTPSNDFYGGRRPGQNLFAESLVCLDAATGKRKWHYQIVHHGLWDYDLPGPPSLVTITVNGKRIDAVVQLTKTGFAFVFDRVTGKPVWPIEERPVPASDVAGEHAWPTQPIPTKPPPFAPQGVTLEDAFDLTPELKAEAQAEMKKYRIGPLFTPPSMKGTIMQPGLIGGANWGGGAFDPETGMLYVKSTNQGAIGRLGKPTDADVDADLVRVGNTNPTFHDGLPMLKPPYGHLTAIDLNKGDLAWHVPFGDTPSLRRNPALKGVALPAKLGAPGVPGAMVTKGGIVFVGGGDAALHAVDKANGQDLWEAPLGRRSSGTPMTYRASNGKQYVVIASGTGAEATLSAFTLPDVASAAQTQRYEEVKGWPTLPASLQLGETAGVALDSKGHVFVFHRPGRGFDPKATTKLTEPAVLEFDGESGKLLHSWGADTFLVPHGISIDGEDNVFLTDVGLQQVFKFTHAGKLLFAIGEPRVGAWDATHFNQPTDIGIRPDGSFYVSDGYVNSRVALFDRNGKWLREWGKKGAGEGEFSNPHGLLLVPGGTDVLVADRENSRLQLFDADGKFKRQWTGARDAQTTGRVFGVATDAEGFLYLGIRRADYDAPHTGIVKLDRDWNIVATIGFGKPGDPVFSAVHDLAVGRDGSIYVAETRTKRVVKVRPIRPQ
jgi:quinoprotein glucose dehydrogenase